MRQKTDNTPRPTWELPTSPTHLYSAGIKDAKEPKSGKDPEMEAAPQSTFCISRNVDPKRHSASCRVNQWSCPPQLRPWGLDSQKMISNLHVHEAVAPDKLPHQESGCDSRQMEWCWDGAGNSGFPTAFSKYHLIWAGPKGSASLCKSWSESDWPSRIKTPSHIDRPPALL